MNPSSVLTGVIFVREGTLEDDRCRLQIAVKDRGESLEKERTRLMTEEADLEKQIERQG